MRNPFKNPAVLIALVAFIPMSLSAVGVSYLHEYLTGMKYAQLSFEARAGVPIAGMLITMGCLFFLVPLYRIVAVDEWRRNWKREADAYWDTQQEQTIKNLEEWIVRNPRLDVEYKHNAFHSLHKLRTESPLRH